MITRLSEYLYTIASGTNGYLLVREGRGLLVDCPVAGLADELAEHELPAPATVLHTQVQAEHCLEWDSFPAAEVYVPAGSAEIARRSPAFFAACDTVWPPDREWERRGEEAYGIAGCITERPPQGDLPVACGHDDADA